MLNMTFSDATQRFSAIPHARPPRRAAWPGWALLLIAASVLAVRPYLSAWLFMWLLAAAIFLGCKWQTWWSRRPATGGDIGRSAAYLFLWPGMDAAAFLDPSRRGTCPAKQECSWAAAKTLLGAALLWTAVLLRSSGSELAAGWSGMLGLVMLLHFGTFHLLSVLWRSIGVDARPIMHAPVLATSLSDFWGRRWNLGFRQLTHDLIFLPARVRYGAPLAVLLSFLASGVIHDLVISLPAGGGYGLPTLYFALQGLGVLLERHPMARSLGVSHGVRGRFFVALFTIAPLPLLFHAPFVRGVILPFLSVLGAR
jgi:alginate O-acetyltransferase complex protein AlgI